MNETKNNSSFSIDLHVHSSKYSECAELLDPQYIEEYARKAKIDAVVITEHDTLWRKYEFEELQEKVNTVQLFNGIEVSTENGCHLILIGIEDNGPLYKGIASEDAITYAHEQGGVVILAHPFRKGLPPTKTIARIDAIEICSTSLYENESKLSINLAQIMSKPTIACSDAHALSMIGWAYTNFPNQPENVQHLCRMIKEGAGKPVLANPFFS